MFYPLTPLCLVILLGFGIPQKCQGVSIPTAGHVSEPYLVDNEKLGSPKLESPLQDLSPEIHDIIFANLDAKDMALVSLSGKRIKDAVLSSPQRIRVLYAKKYPAAKLVSPVELYRFCLQDDKGNTPNSPLDFANCFRDVDQINPPAAIPQIRLHFLYDLFNLASLSSQASWILYHILRTTNWTSDQSNALLYYSASSPLFFSLVYHNICGEGDPFEDLKWEILSMPCKRVWIIRALYSPDLALPSKFALEMQSSIMQQDLTKFLHSQRQLHTFTGDHLQFQQQVFGALSEGANIHDPEFKRLLFKSVLAGDRVSDTFPGASVFLRTLFELGLSPTNGLGQSISLIHQFTDPELIRLCLEAGASPNYRALNEAYSPLATHVLDKYREATTFLLLQYGANPNVIQHALHQQTPLMLARNTKVALLLLNAGADPNATNEQLNTPLFNAARYSESPELIKLLLSRGARLEHKNAAKESVLFAVKSVKVMTYLLSLPESRAMLDDYDSLGDTALHLMVLMCRLPMVRLLVEAGASPNLQNDNMKLSPLMITKDINTARYLIEEARVDMNLQDKDGNTALIRAVINRKYAIAEALVLAGADMSIRNFYNPPLTALDIALDDPSYEPFVKLITEPPVIWTG